MQRLGKHLTVEKSWQSGDLMLHKTVSGYQLGEKIVTDISEVASFNSDIREEVGQWLESDGVKQAIQAKNEAEVADAAEMQPGTLDAMADKVGPGVKANLYAMLKSAIQDGKTGDDVLDKMVGDVKPASEDGVIREKVDGGVIVSRPGQPREFVPDANIGDEAVLERSGPEQPALVGVGGGDNPSDSGDGDSTGEMSAQIAQKPRRGRKNK